MGRKLAHPPVLALLGARTYQAIPPPHGASCVQLVLDPIAPPAFPCLPQVRKGETRSSEAVLHREKRLREMMADVLKEDRKAGYEGQAIYGGMYVVCRAGVADEEQCTRVKRSGRVASSVAL